MGIDPSWFISYLSNRMQTVSINGISSEFLNLSCGVPQGSLLGPLLYLCYSNDMEISVTCKLLLYADDSVLVVSGKDPDVISKRLGTELASCNQWLIDNNLSLHVGKTECIIFGSKRKLNKVSEFSVEYGNTKISSKKCVRYLGVTIDQCLSGDAMATSIISKTIGKLKFLYRYKSILSQNLRKKLSTALLQCHFDYCATAWYPSLSIKMKRKMQITQNKIVRFVLNLGPREHIGQLELNSLGFLNVNDRVEQLRLNQVYKIYHNSSPVYLTSGFELLANAHKVRTRASAKNFYVQQLKGSESNTFHARGINDWNNLPEHVKNIENYIRFKREAKRFLVKRATSKELSVFT